MGQGNYTMVALGTTVIPERPDAIDEDDWEGWDSWGIEEMPDSLRTQYEAPPYIAIPIAVSDGWLEEYWKVGALNDSVIALDDVATQFADRISDARAVWREAQRVIAAHGRELAEPRLLLISDFD